MRRLHDYIASLPVEEDGYTVAVGIAEIESNAKITGTANACASLKRAFYEDWLTIDRVPRKYRFKLLDSPSAEKPEGAAA